MPDFSWIDDMTDFDDEAFPCSPTEVTAAPEWPWLEAVGGSGVRQRVQGWDGPLWSFQVGLEAVTIERMEQLMGFWLARGGGLRSFPLRHPYDYSTAGCTGQSVNAPTATDVVLGLALTTGANQTFPLLRQYPAAVSPYSRRVRLPVAGSVKVSRNNVALASNEFTISRPGGVVTVTISLNQNDVIRAGCLFDYETQFSSSATVELRRAGVAGFGNISLNEVFRAD